MARESETKHSCWEENRWWVRGPTAFFGLLAQVYTCRYTCKLTIIRFVLVANVMLIFSPRNILSLPYRIPLPCYQDLAVGIPASALGLGSFQACSVQKCSESTKTVISPHFPIRTRLPNPVPPPSQQRAATRHRPQKVPASRTSQAAPTTRRCIHERESERGTVVTRDDFARCSEADSHPSPRCIVSEVASSSGVKNSSIGRESGTVAARDDTTRCSEGGADNRPSRGEVFEIPVQMHCH